MRLQPLGECFQRNWDVTRNPHKNKNAGCNQRPLPNGPLSLALIRQISTGSPGAMYENKCMTIVPSTVRLAVRMDKWLWAARFFKTRALASRACDIGRIHSNEIQAKPARDVRIGDMLKIKNEAGEFEVEVLLLSEMRGPAAVAQALYRETDASREQRLKLAAEQKAMQQMEGFLPIARPSKRDRRQINRFRGRG